MSDIGSRAGGSLSKALRRPTALTSQDAEHFICCMDLGWPENPTATKNESYIELRIIQMINVSHHTNIFIALFV